MSSSSRKKSSKKSSKKESVDKKASKKKHVSKKESDNDDNNDSNNDSNKDDNKDESELEEQEIENDSDNKNDEENDENVEDAENVESDIEPVLQAESIRPLKAESDDELDHDNENNQTTVLSPDAMAAKVAARTALRADVRAKLREKAKVKAKAKAKAKQKARLKAKNKKRKIQEGIGPLIDIDGSGTFNEDNVLIIKQEKPSAKVVMRRDKNQTTWVDKYRPKTINDIIGHEEMKETLMAFIERGNLPHLLLYGGSGTGKTSTATALKMQLYGPHRIDTKVLELNASDENGIVIIRDKIIPFARLVVGTDDPNYPSPPFKIVILDEADSMTSEAQTALKKVMESTCDITRFIFICNYESKIIDAIKSRCASFRFSPVPQDLMIEKLSIIAEEENIDISEDVLRIITDICEGDARRSINTLQNTKYIPKKTITIDDICSITSYMDKSYFDKYWNKILNLTVDKLSQIVIELVNTGYPMGAILQCIKDKLFDSDMEDNMLAKITVHIGAVERMITSGSDNYIQLFAVISYINGLYKGHDIEMPKIF